MASTSYPPQERAYYDSIFASVDSDSSGVLSGQDALPLLMSANLPQQTLGEIWALADPDNNGFLTKESWYKAARIVGWMQKGGKTSVDESLTSQAGPLPTFQGHAPPPSSTGVSKAQPPPLSAQSTGQSLPALTAADRAKFTKIFVGCGPSNGLVSGDKARDVFLKSQLSYDKLGQIWGLADTQGRGSLDLTDFIIGMYLIQSSMANPALNLPQTLPSGTYEAASGGRAPPTSPIARQNTGPSSPIRQQYTGPIQQQRTGQSFSGQQPMGTPTRSSTLGLGPSFGGVGAWDVTTDAKSTSDRFFSQLDQGNKGFIEGDVAVPFMLQSQLDESTLATIWDLADIRKEGRLNRDEFAVAMHLINAKLAGRDPPTVLPLSLVPPSLRNEYSGGQGALSSPVGAGPSSATKDLFDLFADDPPPVTSSPAPGAAPRSPQTQQQQAPPSAFLPQPPSRRGTAPPPPTARHLSPHPTGQSTGPSPSAFATNFAPASDLLGDDSVTESAKVPDHSAEIGNSRNQLENTNRGLSTLEKERASLEISDKSSAAELEDLQKRLTEARAKHESETKAVSDLRTRVSEQKEKIQSLNMDFIAAQSDVSALQSERDELEQGLLQGKEEVRDLQRRMKEIDEEKSGLKLLLEKLKKDARQQKGMVSIAKKQLATSEGGRDSVQGEIRTLEQEAEVSAQEHARSPSVNSATGVPLPTTPQALSPTQTGVSTRSNNPFDRLRGVASPPIQHEASTPSDERGPSTGAVLGVGAAIGAAAGVVAAGAETLYEAAKEVVSPGSEARHLEEDGTVQAPPQTASAALQPQEPAQQSGDDPFAISTNGADPFGASGNQASSNDFDSGFDDAFGAQEVPTTAQGAQGSADFDSAFAEFDEASTAPQSGLPSGIPKSAVPYLRPETERSASTQAVLGESVPVSPQSTVPEGATVGDSSLRNNVTESVDEDSSDDEHEGPEDLEAPTSRYQAKADNTPVLYPPVTDAAVSSVSQPLTDEAPSEDLSSQPPAIGRDAGTEAEPIIASTPFEAPKTRRSAPPPPASKTTLPPPVDDFDPFASDQRGEQDAPADSADPFGTAFASNTRNAAPLTEEPSGLGSTAFDETPFDTESEPTLPPGAAPALPINTDPAQPSKSTFATGFDDDDFDFSDLPPAQIDETKTPTTTHQQVGSGKDDFDFDDEFDQPSNSDGSKSYEMVSPPSGSIAQPLPTGSGQPPTSATRDSSNDAWGFTPFSAPVQPPAAQAQDQVNKPAGFSFDDAFGGDFEPAPTTAATTGHESTAPGSSALSPPALPERRDSGVGAQPDDIEDVKKLCAMGFPRSLVVEALAANSYDFQKTLNVLLQ